ncbi:MAG: class I SAM-dependent methyltransferase [Saprospiraceae bacterium]
MMKYRTCVHEFQIGKFNISIEKVSNIDELFEALLAKGDAHEDVKDERIPYWAELWPSALALSKHMCEMNIEWSGKKILEIGAGLGLPSIVAGKLGGDITVSDYLPEAVAFSKQNCLRNLHTEGNFIALDWREPNLVEPVDILLAADIAYEKRMFPFLPGAFKQLCKSDGLILLSEPNRAFAKPFFAEMQKNGLKVKQSVQVEQSLFGVDYLVNIFEIRLS